MRADMRLCQFVIWTLAALVCESAFADEAADFFENKVRPVLVKNCLACHGSGVAKMGGLQLDSRDHLMAGGHDGPVIVPGDPERSMLIQAVRKTHGRFKMPPQGKLTDQEIADLSSWVKSGAVWPDAVAAAEPNEFWAFQPVRKPRAPTVSGGVSGLTDIDRFIRAKLESNGLKPGKRAEKRALIRRATFDLIGLPPTPAEVDAFVNDASERAFAKVVDRLLASPHYGERWGRYWLDLARYSDGQLGASKDEPFLNAYRYRDWVIRSLNEDMPYDLFAKAQIAGDLLPSDDPQNLIAGLGFYALGPDEDDRVDVTGQVFLGLTVGCARCHDHKYDPIPTKDFYSLLGVFKSSDKHQFPLASEAVVEAHKRAQKDIQQLKNTIDDFVNKHSTELSELLAAKTSRYMMAAWDAANGQTVDATALKLDETTLRRWIAYLNSPGRDYKFLDPWDELIQKRAPRDEAQKFADEFERFVVQVFADKHAMDDRNYVKLGGAAGVRDEKTRQYTNLESLPIEQYYLWRDLASEPYRKDFLDFKGGVYYYGAKEIDRFLAAEWREHHEALNMRLARLQKEAPPQYSFLHALTEGKKPADVKVYVRGDEKNQGEVAPRRYLTALSKGEPPALQTGSGRLPLANLIADAANPLFARVMVNRIWQHHFGRGLVGTPSNFGQLGERPSHPELLDYLAATFVEQRWSLKAMHRMLMLSETYQLSTDTDEANLAKDPENRWLGRANLRQRLDAEALRDALLAVSGELDRTIGGPAIPLGESNKRRTVYALIGRTKPNAEMALFDFPNPNATSEQRMVTVGPMQRLYLMNNEFVVNRAKALAERIAGEGDTAARITSAYRLLYGREPNADELRLGADFAAKGQDAWPKYMQVLLASAEFSSVN
jgi:hypothetical protein